MKNEQIVLLYFLEQARGGRSACDVFDACYETNLHCAELLPVLEGLLAKKELEREDLRTYRFVGSLDPRSWEEEKQYAPEALRKRVEEIFPSKDGSDGEQKDDYVRTMKEWREMREKRAKFFDEVKKRETQGKREACFAELRKERDRLKAHAESGKEIYDKEAQLFFLRRNALRAVLDNKSVGIAFLQRKMQIGYNHAGELLQWMEENGLVSSFDMSLKARIVLYTRKELEENCDFEEGKTEERKEAKSDSDGSLLTIRALRWAIARGRINAVLLCGRFSVSEAEANEMMRWMFERGYITSPEEALSTTLLTRAEFEKLFPFGGGEDGEGGAD